MWYMYTFLYALGPFFCISEAGYFFDPPLFFWFVFSRNFPPRSSRSTRSWSLWPRRVGLDHYDHWWFGNPGRTRTCMLNSSRLFFHGFTRISHTHVYIYIIIYIYILNIYIRTISFAGFRRVRIVSRSWGWLKTPKNSGFTMFHQRNTLDADSANGQLLNFWGFRIW